MPVKYQTSVPFAALALLLIAPSSHAEWTSSSRPLPFSGVRPASQDDQVKANLRSGAEAMHTGKADEAEHYFREVTRIAPDLPEGYLDLGVAQLRQGKLPDAVASLQKALVLNQRIPAGHMFLGITYYQMGRFDDARTALQQEIELNAGNAEALLWLGITELAAGHPPESSRPAR